MRQVLIGGAFALMLWPALAVAQSEKSTIQVVASGSVETRPDLATIRFDIRGEGRTSGDDEDAPRLSTEACAIQGYVASLVAQARVSPVSKAGALTGLASRAGGTEVSLSGFTVSDPGDARQRAMRAALASGRAEAEAIGPVSTWVRLTLTFEIVR
jgi:uncharacterized protein YggE